MGSKDDHMLPSSVDSIVQIFNSVCTRKCTPHIRAKGNDVVDVHAV